ncbi:MAG: glycosyltransferase family 61 protein [Halobacteriales archaeon]|nr:glycosyltransferase family 61 protein [Halobacteriales archaeon]
MSMVTFIDIYGHWLQDYLPMLLHLSVYEEKTGRKPDIIVDKNPADWMLETLRVLGYDEDRIIEWDNGFAVVDRLVLPNASRVAHTPSRTRMSPVEYRWLRERFLQSVEGTDTSKNERFYISRQGMRNPSGLSGERYVTNFDEVREVLSDFDIEVVRPETMTIEEQVRKFSRGGLFVGPRGSGLHNTLFAKNSKTVEIYTPNTRHHIQHLFDYALGHEWTYIIGSEYDKSTDSEEDRNMPFRVNPDVLRSKLEDVLPDE